MSTRIIRAGLRYMNSARAFAVSVLPTPVGPTKQHRADRPPRRRQARLDGGQHVDHQIDRPRLAHHPAARRTRGSRRAAAARRRRAETAAAPSLRRTPPRPPCRSPPPRLRSASRFFRNRSGRPGSAEYVANRRCSRSMVSMASSAMNSRRPLSGRLALAALRRIAQACRRSGGTTSMRCSAASSCGSSPLDDGELLGHATP